MILTSIARTGSPVWSGLTRSFPGGKPSQNECNERQKGGFPAAGSFATGSLSKTFSAKPTPSADPTPLAPTSSQRASIRRMAHQLAPTPMICDREPSIEKVVILGAGAAGSSAAIFAGQAGLNPIVISDIDCHAQIALIHKIDNYPGIADPIDGYDLLKNFRSQAEGFGARFIEDSVAAIDTTERPFKIELESGKSIYTESLIVATGSNKKWLNISSEQELRGKGVVSATFCKGTDYTGKNVVVIGGGHAALQEAIHIADQANRITIINRGSQFNASKFHQNAVFDSKNIEVIYNSEVTEINDVTLGKVTNVWMRNLLTLQEEQLAADIVIVSIGSTPNTEIFKDQLELTDSGSVVIKGSNTSTNVPGIFGAGDVTNVSYGRVVISAGSGAMAALDAVRYLDMPFCQTYSNLSMDRY